MAQQVKIDKVIRSARRSVAFVVSVDGELIVRAPQQLSLTYIEKLVSEKADWIERKKREMSKRRQATKKNFSAGGEFLYLGNKYRLVVTEGIEIALGVNGQLLFPRVFLWRLKARLLDWYKKQAKRELVSRVESLASQVGLKYSSVDISQAKGCWGSCSPQNALHLNWRLIMAPEEVMKYVILHELVHILEKNHSARFWNKLAEFFPEYAKQHQWLRKNGHLLEL